MFPYCFVASWLEDEKGDQLDSALLVGIWRQNCTLVINHKSHLSILAGGGFPWPVNFGCFQLEQSVSNSKRLPQRYRWNCLQPKTMASASFSICPYFISVSVSDRLPRAFSSTKSAQRPWGRGWSSMSLSILGHHNLERIRCLHLVISAWSSCARVIARGRISISS